MSVQMGQRVSYLEPLCVKRLALYTRSCVPHTRISCSPPQGSPLFPHRYVAQHLPIQNTSRQLREHPLTCPPYLKYEGVNEPDLSPYLYDIVLETEVEIMMLSCAMLVCNNVFPLGAYFAVVI